MSHIAAASIVLLAASTLAAETKPARWQISLASYVADGDYGGDVDTRFGYAPLSLRWMARRGDVTVVVPYLDVRSTTSVVLFRGQPQPVAPTPARPSDTRRSTPTPTPTPRTAPTTPAAPTRTHGLGDVAVAGRLFLVDAVGLRPSVDLLARVELPTGDPDRGLGLGAAAAEIGLQLTKPMGRLVALADASYTFVGRPDGFDVRDTWEYAVGLGFYPVRPLLVSVSFEEWRSVSPAVANGRDVLAAAHLKAGRSLRFFVSAQMPLSSSAPDVTAGGGVGVRF
jgi:hypothetical protein